jgi:hypothetical protein
VTYAWKDERGGDGGIHNLQIPSMNLTVHRHIDYEPDQWIFSCYQLGIQHHELKAKELAAAKSEAVAFAKGRLADYVKALEAV